MATLKDIFGETGVNGINVDSPQFEVAYNTDPKSSGKGSTSSATIDFRVYYEPEKMGEVSAYDMNQVKTLAYEFLRSSGKLTLGVYGDSGNGAMALKSLSVKPVPGTDVWEVTAKYDDSRSSNGSSAETALKNFQFSTQGRTSHIVQSLETVSKTDAWGGTGFDFNQMIGWNDGDFAGVDVKRPNLTFSRDVWIMADNMDFAFIRRLSWFTGSVNADEFYGFEPGTVQFTGVSQGQRATLKIGNATLVYWQITLGFETSPNYYVPWGTSQVYKRGWDYVWYLQTKVVATSDAGKMVFKSPMQINVERVYEYRNFCDFFGFGYSDSIFEDEGLLNG